MVLSILLYGYTTWTLTKRIEKKLDGNCARMFRAILNKSWKQHPTKQKLYSRLPPISKIIKVRRTRHVGYCWRIRDELISNVLRWTPPHGRTNVSTPLLPSLPCPLWPRVVALDRVLSMGRIELNCVLILNWIFKCPDEGVMKKPKH